MVDSVSGSNASSVSNTQSTQSQAQANAPGNKVDSAVAEIKDVMKDGGWTEDDLTNGELKQIAGIMKGLNKDEANQVMSKLSDAEVNKITDEMDSSGIGNFNGLSKTEKQDFVGDLAGKLDSTQFGRVAKAFDDPQEIADVVAAKGTTDAKIGFIDAYKDSASSAAQPGAWYENIGVSTTKFGNESARAIGTVLGSLGNDSEGLKRAIGSTDSKTGEFTPGLLSREQLRTVVDASMEQSSTIVASQGGASLPSYSFRSDKLNNILDAVATSKDAGLKAEVFTAASQSLGKVQGVGGFLTPSANSHKEAAAISDHMGSLLKTDTRGIINKLEADDPSGNALTPFTRQQLADGKTDNLQNMVKELRNGPKGDAAQYLKDPQHAQDLGYALGAVASGLKSLDKSAKAEAEILNKLLGFGISRIPGGVSDVISFASETAVKNTVGEVSKGAKAAPLAFYELMVKGMPPEIQMAVDAAMSRVINLQDLK
jgi:hypothetical protein